MLTEAEHRLLELNPEAKVYLFGQEILKKTWAVCSSDMLIKGQEASNIVFGDTLEVDGFPGRRFDYVIANPPYGSDWSGSMTAVKKDHERGFAGRFGAGLPAKSDGQLLFVQHMLAKAKPADEGGGRVAVVLNASPLFAGDAGSGESNIRKWLFEHDYVEAIIGLPDQLFYNTGIYTYIWILSTRKSAERQGLVQLIDARVMFQKMPKSLGDKRNELSPDHVHRIVTLYESFTSSPESRIMRNEEFGYTRVTIERPLRLKYALTADSQEKVQSTSAFKKLPATDQGALLACIEADGAWETIDRLEAESRVAAWTSTLPKVGKPLRDSLLAAVSIPDPAGCPVEDRDGQFKPDSGLRDYEYIALGDDIDAYLDSHVRPYSTDAWRTPEGDRIGYEIPFRRIFYTYAPPRPLEVIDEEIKQSQARILRLIGGVQP
jgi:type I restriction enzyme M protein